MFNTIFGLFRSHSKQKAKNTWLETFGYHISMKTRYKILLSLINLDNISSILDLGCGPQYLYDVLSQEGWHGKYTGVDLYQHKQSTLLCDFNKGQFPLYEKYDLVVIAGLLEYIHDVKKLLINVKYITNKFLLVSYIFNNFCIKSNRIWAPLISQEQFFNILLKRCSFSLLKLMPDPFSCHNHTTSYMLFRSNNNVPTQQYAK